MSVVKSDVPTESVISNDLSNAHYFDSYELHVETNNRSSLQIFLDIVANTPKWINRLMAVRNNIASTFGLKNLGHLGAIDSSKQLHEYQVGDRVGIFTLLSLSDNEVVLGDYDKHLDVKVSIYKGNSSTEPVVISTVVHIHNMLGKIYMLIVTPIHKRIVPAMLIRAGTNRINA